MPDLLRIFVLVLYAVLAIVVPVSMLLWEALS